jgi:hypothetical protein
VRHRDDFTGELMDPVSIDEKRKQKQKRCQICGEAQHDFLGQCKRVAAITQEADGGETYHLYPPEVTDPPAA